MNTQWIRFAKTRALASVLAGAAWILSDSATAQGGRPRDVDNGREAAANEVLVKFNRPQNANERAQTRASVDADVDEDLVVNGVRRIRSRRFDAATLVNFFQGAPNVEYAEPNYILYAIVTPNDPSFGQLYGLL